MAGRSANKKAVPGQGVLWHGLNRVSYLSGLMASLNETTKLRPEVRFI
jgi:hypothetical protein